MRLQKSGKPLRVVVGGISHFCRKLEALLQSDEWNVRYHSDRSVAGLAALAKDLCRADLVYKWGGQAIMGKFLWAARCLGPQNFVMLWAGSDALWARRNCAEGQLNPWIAGKTHWAVAPWLAEELRSVGIPCEYTQVSFVSVPEQTPPLPEQFSVLAFIPSAEHASFYGWDHLARVARALPQIEFNVVGFRSGRMQHIPANVHIRGWIEDMPSLLTSSTVLYRPVQHDGMSFMVLEALAHGRHVLYSRPLANCLPVSGAQDAQQELERLFELHQRRRLLLNEAGVQMVTRDFSRERVRRELFGRWRAIVEGKAPGKLASVAKQGVA